MEEKKLKEYRQLADLASMQDDEITKKSALVIKALIQDSTLNEKIISLTERISEKKSITIKHKDAKLDELNEVIATIGVTATGIIKENDPESIYTPDRHKIHIKAQGIVDDIITCQKLIKEAKESRRLRND